MNLYDKLPTSLTYKGRKYKLNLSFDRVLEMFDLQGRTDLSDAAKLEASLFLLVKTRHRPDVGLLEAVIGLLTEPGRQADNKRSFDFRQDAKYIYSAFMQAYGIDLFEQRDKLHWWKFLAMLNGLPSDTRFSEIVQLRLRPMPKPTKYNAQERAELARQKAMFRLEVSEEERQANLQSGLLKMFRALEGMARGKG